MTINYGIGAAEGRLISDRVCIDSSATHCVNDYKILAVYSTTSLQNVRASGLVGMAPSNQKGAAPIFMAKMEDAGAVT